MADNGIHGPVTSLGLEAALGRRLAEVRLARNITQKDLAKEAGLGLRTLRRIETGHSSSLDSFLRIVIALGLAEGFLNAIPSQEIRPIERVTSRRRERKRARPVRSPLPEKPWSWGDESDD